MESEKMGSETNRESRKRGSGPWKIKYIAINIFLVFHILAITAWCMPINSPLIQVCRNAVRPYFLWSGIFQSWDMFSPSPVTQNTYMEAIVIFKDGSTQLWSFPRMELLSYTQRYVKERYRKFEESLQDGQKAALWTDAAIRIARLNSTPSNPAKAVMLVVRWSDIILPHGDDTYDRGPWNVNVFYKYDVKPEDLR